MEDLIQKLDELINVVDRNTMPLWASVILALVPIAISVVVLIVTYLQHNQNKKLQKDISEKNAELQERICKRECVVQMHNDFLKIYEGYCLAQNSLIHFGEDAVETLFDPTEALSWYRSYIDNFNVLIRSCDLAFLLLPNDNKKFRDVLKNILDEHNKLIDEIEDYMYSSEYQSSILEAWNNINSTYGIDKNDYKKLRANRKAYNSFIKLCGNDTVTKINEHKNRLRKLYKYENFDVYFEPYVRVE